MAECLPAEEPLPAEAPSRARSRQRQAGQAQGKQQLQTQADPPCERDYYLKRYREKRKRRLPAKTVRYVKRKANADSRWELYLS